MHHVGTPDMVTYISFGGMIAFYTDEILKLTLVDQGDKLAWALMPSGQNGVRTSEFELSFKSTPSVLKPKQRALSKLKHSKCMALGYFD
jgi:hypothetical protein